MGKKDRYRGALIDRVQLLMMQEGWTEQTVLRLLLDFLAETEQKEALIAYLDRRK